MRLGPWVALLCLSVTGRAGAAPTAAEVTAYCEGRAANLPRAERGLASASCALLVPEIYEALAGQRVDGAIDRLRSLDERMRPRVTPAAPAACPPPPPPPACPPERACPPHASPPERVRPSSHTRPAAPRPQRRTRELEDPFGSRGTARPKPVDHPEPAVERKTETTPPEKQKQGRDLMAPFGN